MNKFPEISMFSRVVSTLYAGFYVAKIPVKISEELDAHCIR